MKSALKGMIKVFKKKLKTLKTLILNSICYFVYYHVPIKNNLVVFESRDSRDFTGNIFRIAQELSSGKYGKYRMYAFVKKDGQKYAKPLAKANGINICFVSREKVAVAIMEMAKYIVADSTLPQLYVKREGQVVLNTWHGTPLKKMGKEEYAAKNKIGNVQHSFFCCNYLLYSSEYTRDIMLRDYMIENVYLGKVLVSGYPRNTTFFDDITREKLRKVFGFDNKQIFAYMPTHRGNRLNRKYEEQCESVNNYLRKLDNRLNDDQLLLVKLHVFNQSKLEFSSFKHILPFPIGYETYDVLNTADCLITDYSSVFYDFANTRRKIILFAYDKDEYFDDRGTYLPLEALPFPIVSNIDALVSELNSPKNYDDTEFIKKYCPFDDITATEKLCRHVFNQEEVLCEQTVGNGKDNVLISGDSLWKNGITTSLRNLLNSLDNKERNYLITFDSWGIKNPSELFVIPQRFDYIPFCNAPVMTLLEKILFKKYVFHSKPGSAYPPKLRKCFQREMHRYYPNVNFSHIIHFSGYGSEKTLLFAESGCKNTIYVHNNMIDEINTRRNQSKTVLNKAYSEYDSIAVVSADLIEPTVKLGASVDRIRVVSNVHDVYRIREEANESICFQKTTECHTYNPNGIQGVMNGKGKKFITIGRFSSEKGHQCLLNAFDEFCNDYPETNLIIIGGHGALYKKTLNWASSLKHWQNVSIIKSIDNPMPILKQCDFFILSSLYEGLGLVLLEADCLGVPSCTTDCCGSRELYREKSGYIAENSEAGILQAMYDFMDGKISTLQIDYDEYYKQACREFQSLF